MKKRGGRRPGAGRKPKPKIDFASKDIAERVLELCAPPIHIKDCGCEVCGWWELLKATDLNIRGITRRYLTDRKYGKAAQRIATDPIQFDPNAPLKVIIEHIGRAAHPPAAQTK